MLGRLEGAQEGRVARERDRLAFLKQFPHDEPGVEGARFFAAYLDCLPPEAVCELVDTGFQRRAEERRAVLRRLKRDLEAGVTPRHERMLDDILERVPGLLYRQQEQAYLFLFELMDLLPKRHRQRTLALALGSSCRGQRERAYGPLLKAWDDRFSAALVHNMEVHGDFGAAAVAVECWPVEELSARRALIEPLVQGSKAFNQLYLHLASVNPAVIESLRMTHPVTYAVLLVRLGRALRPDEALAMYQANENPAVSYLWLWCFGRWAYGT